MRTLRTAQRCRGLGRRWILVVAIIAVSALAWGGGAAFGYDKAAGQKSGFVTATDGVKIHYVEAGKALNAPSAEVGNPLPSGTVAAKGNIAVTGFKAAPSILFVPGWTMPAWIWQKQIDALSKKYRVVAMDPRSQGESTRTWEGLYPAQRARDIRSVIEQLHLAPVVIVGWSMAVVETLSYVDQFGTKDVAGLVLVDEIAGGQQPGDAQWEFGILKSVLDDRKNATDGFVRKIQFHKPQPEEYIQRVIAAALSVPTSDAVALLVGRYTADYRAVLPKIDRPTLVCAAKSPFFDRVVEMQRTIPGSQLEVFEGDGHALFVDDPEKFNAAIDDFVVDLR
jgi:non-heme chloroperoxidase